MIVLCLQKTCSEFRNCSSLIKHNIACSLPLLGVTGHGSKKKLNTHTQQVKRAIARESVPESHNYSLGYVPFVAYVSNGTVLANQKLIHCSY